MGNTRNIEHIVRIKAAAKVVFNALITPSLIKQWWYVHTAIVVPELGGIYALAWGESIDAPDYVTVSRLTEYEFGKKLSMANESYYSPHGNLPFEAELVAHLTLDEEGEETVVKVLQTGIPTEAIADEFYAGTVKGWETTMLSLKNVAEDEAMSTAGLLEDE